MIEPAQQLWIAWPFVMPVALEAQTLPCPYCTEMTMPAPQNFVSSDHLCTHKNDCKAAHDWRRKLSCTYDIDSSMFV